MTWRIVSTERYIAKVRAPDGQPNTTLGDCCQFSMIVGTDGASSQSAPQAEEETPPNMIGSAQGTPLITSGPGSMQATERHAYQASLYLRSSARELARLTRIRVPEEIAMSLRSLTATPSSSYQAQSSLASSALLSACLTGPFRDESETACDDPLLSGPQL